MYSNLLNFKDIHIVSKIFSLIICASSIFIVENPIFLLLFLILFSTFFFNLKMVILALALIGLSFISPIFLVISKVLFIVLTIILLSYTIDLPSLRYFIECAFYKQRKSKGTYIALHICYFSKYFYSYVKDYISLSKSYGKKIKFFQFLHILKESLIKTKSKIDSLLMVYRYRFYNSYKKRTYIEKPEITSVDIKYVLIFVILFFVVYVYGR